MLTGGVRKSGKTVQCKLESVEIVILVVLRALAGEFQSETFISELIHPDTRHHLHRSLVGASFVARLRRRRSLSTKLPAFVDELVHRISCLKHKDCAELLHSHPQARLNLEHLHVGSFLRAVVESDALSFSPTGEQNLHAEIAEGCVSGRRFDSGLSRGPRF